MNTTEYYATLIKPFFAPPSWIFSPVWTILYILIIISFGYVGCLYFKRRIEFKVLLPFILNITANLAYSPIAFGLNNLVLATVDILLVLWTLIWALKVIHPHAKWVTYINIPYVVWVAFATVVQISITVLNT